MKKLSFKVLFSLCLSTWLLSSQAQQAAETMPLSKQSLILSITQVGDAVIMVGERGHVLKSEDAGKSWRQIEGVPVNIALTKVVSVNNHVWAVGHDAAIIHSADAGETWELQFYDAEREVPLLSVYFINETDGFAVGAYGTVLSTQDSGKNWDDGLVNDELDYHLNDIKQGPNGELYLAAEAGYFFKSTDLGETWEDIELPYMGSMFGVNIMGDDIVLFGLRGHVLISSDQGMTWDEIEAEIPNNLFGSDRVNEQKLLLVGANGARLVYQNKTLKALSETDSGDDYSDVLVLGGQVMLVGEEGIKIQAMGQ